MYESEESSEEDKEIQNNERITNSIEYSPSFIKLEENYNKKYYIPSNENCPSQSLSNLSVLKQNNLTTFCPSSLLNKKSRSTFIPLSLLKKPKESENLYLSDIEDDDDDEYKPKII